MSWRAVMHSLALRPVKSPLAFISHPSTHSVKRKFQSETALKCLAGPRCDRTARLESRGSFSYYRVTTDKHRASGLGLAAQRDAVARHVAGVRGMVVAEFQEIESGKRNDRPQIAAALAACRLRRATLVIAKLDRLARNVHFISSL